MRILMVTSNETFLDYSNTCTYSQKWVLFQLTIQCHYKLLYVVRRSIKGSNKHA